MSGSIVVEEEINLESGRIETGDNFKITLGSTNGRSPRSNSAGCSRIHLMSCMRSLFRVMAGLVPAIPITNAGVAYLSKMPGTRPGMTE